MIYKFIINIKLIYTIIHKLLLYISRKEINGTALPLGRESESSFRGGRIALVFKK